MSKTKTKKAHFWVGSFLVAAFSAKFLLVGISSFFVSSYFLPAAAQAEFFDRGTTSSFTYQTDTLRNLEMINVRSFLGKPVQIPLESNNPQGVPGGDRDYVIVYPPKVLNANASIPLRAIYFSSGKEIDEKSVKYVQNIEQYINSVGNNNPVLLEIIKNLLEKNLRVSVKDEKSFLSLLFNQVHAEDTETNPLVSENGNDNQDTSLDTSNPQTKQLLVLILLLLILNQSMAESINKDKENCQTMGGEIVNGECVSEEKNACEDNGGNFRKFNDQCSLDKQSCGNEDLQCSSSSSSNYWSDNSNDNEDTSVYGCACPKDKCLEDGVCISQDNGQKQVCENSGGRWRSFFSQEELCMQKCDVTQTECRGAWSGGDTGATGDLMGCDCSSNCLAPSGACIEKDKTKDDDDKDNVPNGQDRCPNTPQGEAANNVSGSPDQGCSCSQLQNMGRIQKPQQQCPPDGCDDRYMVRYDRSAQNNPNGVCQNGIIQQQQNTGTCPVISREPTDQCERDADRRNANNNNNSLEDLLNRLLNNGNNNNNQGKKGNDNKDKDKNNGSSSSSSSSSSGGTPQQPPTPNGNTNNSNGNGNTNDNSSVSGNPGSDPKGVGAYNAKQDGTTEKPYALHVSQFTKVCGENTYVLTNAAAGAGDSFKDDPNKQNNGAKPGDLPSPAADIDKLACMLGGNCGQKTRDDLKEIVNSNWSKLDPKNQKMIIDAIKNGPALDQLKIDKVKDIINKAPKITNPQPQTPVNSNDHGAKSMKELVNKNDTYFKVPKCEELAANHCCVCSCCDKAKKDCGWSIGKSCDNGKCQGQNCDADSCKNCNEDPAKSIQLLMAKPIPSELKQSDNKCYELDHDKKKTATNLCKNYKDPTHVGICRYDCEGGTKGCEEGSGGCKIIVQVKDGKDLKFSMEENKSRDNGVKPGSTLVKFTNEKDGSIIRGLQGSGSEWMDKLLKEKGKACNCSQEPKNADGSDGLNSGIPSATSGQPPAQGTPPPPVQPPAAPNGQPPLDDKTLHDDYAKFRMDNLGQYLKSWLIPGDFPTFEEYEKYRNNFEGINNPPSYWDWERSNPNITT